MTSVVYKPHLWAIKKIPKDIQSWLSYNVNCKKLKQTVEIFSYNVISKKNYQPSVSSADREIPTLGSMNNADKSVNLIFHINCLLLGWDFSVKFVSDPRVGIFQSA